MRRLMIFCCIPLMLAAGAAVANPIPNGSFADRKAGWFDGREATCPSICKRQNATAVAEHEPNTAPPADVSYVCKVRKASGGPYLWLYGTQLATRPACYTTDRDLKGEYSQIFYCLCVQQRPRIKQSPTLQRSRDDG